MEEHFCQYYYETMIKILQEVKILDTQKLSKLVSPLAKTKSKGKQVTKNKDQAIRPTHLHRLSYLYECCTCTSIVIAKHFQKLMKSDFDSIPKILQKQNINICCLPGTPGTEAVSIIKLFTGKLGRIWDDEAVHMKFHVTFVDVDDGWKDIVEVLLETSRELNDAWHIPKVTFRFENVAPSLPFCVENVEIFQSADIIMMVKNFLDISDMTKKIFDGMLKIAFENMKADSLFFCLDSSSGEYIKQISNMLQTHECFYSIYKHPYDSHSLNLPSIQEHLNLYKDHFGRQLNTHYCNESAAAWLRVSKNLLRPSLNEKNERWKGKSKILPSAENKEKRNARKKAQICKPGKPQKPEIVDCDSTKVELTWKAPENVRGRRILHYIVEMTDISNEAWIQVLKTEDNKCRSVVRSLKTNTVVKFRIRAVNKAGFGEPSDVIDSHFITNKHYKASAPSGPLIVEDVGTDRVKLKWKEPEDIGGQELLGYIVEKTDEDTGRWVLSGRVDSNADTFTVTGLMPKKQYNFRIKALNNDGESPALVSIKTIETKELHKPLSPCGPLIAEEVGTDHVKLKWRTLENTGEQELECCVVEKMDEEAGTWELAGQVAPNENTFIATGLIPKNKYKFRIRAVNKAGASPALVTKKVIEMKYIHKCLGCKTNAGCTSELKEVWSKRSCFDVLFSVKSSNGKKYTFVAHKKLLAMQSTAFADMFQGSESKECEVINVVVSDIGAFQFMLSYLYGWKPDFTCNKLLLEVYKLADKFKIKNLKMTIKYHFLKANVTKDNIAELWNAANRLNSINLRFNCITAVKTRTIDVLRSKDIHCLPSSIITTLISMKRMSLQSEYELVKLVFYWARSKYIKTINCTSIREILQRKLSHLKFLELSCKQLAELVENYKLVFEDSEVFSIFMNIASPGSYPLPSWVNGSATARTFL